MQTAPTRTMPSRHATGWASEGAGVVEISGSLRRSDPPSAWRMQRLTSTCEPPRLMHARTSSMADRGGVWATATEVTNNTPETVFQRRPIAEAEETSGASRPSIPFPPARVPRG